jgi:tetratricopeptide (TPR) repeat protein
LRAIAYSPEDATAHQWYALLLRTLGRGDEAVAHGRRAAELDPLSVQVQNTYAVMLSAAGMRDSAMHVYQRIVTDEPDTAWVRQNPWILSNFGGLSAAAGRHSEAVRLIERAVQVVPGHPRPLYNLAVAYLAVNDSARARAAFARADTAHPHYALYRALMSARLGDLDGAFAWLDRVEEWSPVLIMTITGSTQLKGDQRYEALLDRFGLPQARHAR